MEEEKYKGKFRIPSARLRGWDYGSHGLYFVTICNKDRIHHFGEIEIAYMEEQKQNGAYLQTTEIGKIATENWESIPLYHPYVELDDFTVMPDHMHGIIFINKPDKLTWEVNKFGSQSKNLGSIIRGYKASVKTYATINNIEFSWQARYYDRVIRNEKEYYNIKRYIQDNPDQWYLNGNDFENLFKP